MNDDDFRLRQLAALRLGIDRIVAAAAPFIATSLPIEKAIVREPVPSGDLEKALQVIAARRRRRDYFRTGLLEEPDWDMLLDLYAAQIRGDQISVSSLCIAAIVPPTTALRHITVLEKHGEIEREPDPFDRRRSFLRLSNKAFDNMSKWLRTLPENLV